MNTSESQPEFTEALQCASTDDTWQLVSWTFIAVIQWLLYLVLADTKEREKIAENTHRPVGLSFRKSAFLWLLTLWLSTLGAWNTWRKWCWGGATIPLALYISALFFTLLSWRQYWVVHRFLMSAVCSGLAVILILATLSAFSAKSGESGFLLLPYLLMQIFDSITVWLFYRANRETTIGSRDTGRFQERRDRSNANVWVLSQNPSMHIIPSNFELEFQPKTLGEATRNMHNQSATWD